MSNTSITSRTVAARSLVSERLISITYSYTRQNTCLRLTSGQRILTKGRIVPAFVTPRRMSTYCSRAFAAMRCPLWTSLQPRAAAAFTTYCLMHFNGDNPKFPFPGGDPGPHLIHGSLVQSESTTKTASRSVQPFLQDSWLCPTDKQTDHATTVAKDRILHSLNAMRPNNSI